MKRSRIYYGWYIVAISAAISLLSSGARGGAYGVFIKTLSHEFELDRASVSLPASIGIIVGAILGPFAGRIFDLFGSRKFVTTSLLFMGLSVMTLAATNGLIFLILVYGLIIPIFASGSSQPIFSALIARWFSRRRGTAISLLLGVTALSNLIVLPMITYIMLATGWRTTWLILGMLSISCVPLAGWILRDDPTSKGIDLDGDGSENSSRGNTYQQGRLYNHSWRQALRTTPIWQIIGSFSVMGFCGMPTFVHLIPMGIERGLSPGMAALALGLMGALSLPGMLITGPLSDRTERRYMISLVYGILGLSYLLLILTDGAIGLFAFASVFGMVVMSTGLLTTGLTADIYGVKNLGTVLGIVFLCHFAAGGIGNYFAGIIHDITGTYTLAFITFSMLFSVALLFSWAIRERYYSARFQNIGKFDAL
jgi:MFS family permease